MAVGTEAKGERGAPTPSDPASEQGLGALLASLALLVYFIILFSPHQKKKKKMNTQILLPIKTSKRTFGHSLINADCSLKRELFVSLHV